MKTPPSLDTRLVLLALMATLATTGWPQDAGRPSPGDGGGPPVGGGGPPDSGPEVGGPPPFGPGEFRPADVFLGGPGGPGGFGGPGGPGGMMGQETKLVEQFDRDGDHRLNAAERKAARSQLAQRNSGRRGPRGAGRPGFPGRGGESGPVQPGPRMSPGDVKSYPDAPLYDPGVLRTLFLEFENADWEKELADFKDTDVEVPARLTVDGQVFQDVGVHFRGMSSFMSVGEGRKRSLNLSLDFVHKGQELRGYRTLNLLNSHEDPSFLRTVLALQIARQYLPAPRANFVRVVINGEYWGVYVNAQQFNKDFLRDWFDTTKGARWKVPGSPAGRGGLTYLGDDPDRYRGIYQIKSKDNSESWAALIRLCKVLNETPPETLVPALEPLLDIDGALRFLALENALINNDGYWIRSSDFSLYQDVNGRFHLIPHDENETFSAPGGPGFGGGPGGGFGGGRGPGQGAGPGGMGPGALMTQQVLAQADKNEDRKLGRDEFLGLADAWYDRLDPDKAGQLSREEFLVGVDRILPAPPRGGSAADGPAGPESRAEGPRGGIGPGLVLGPVLLEAVDADKDGSVTREELKGTFGKWFAEWDADKQGVLDEDSLRTGWNAALPRPVFGGGRGGFGPGGGRGRGGPGFGGGARVDGVKLDPLLAANDASKPLLSKLLAVPSLRARYLGYVRDVAEKWLDWTTLGPLAAQHQALIADAVKADTRKLDTTDAFLAGVGGQTGETGSAGPPRKLTLKDFAQQRRAFLLSLSDDPKIAPSGK